MFELHLAIKKAVIYQLMAMILLFCYTWFWFGEPISSLSFTVSFALVLMVYYVSFEYVWDKEIQPAVSSRVNGGVYRGVNGGVSSGVNGGVSSGNVHSAPTNVSAGSQTAGLSNPVVQPNPAE